MAHSLSLNKKSQVFQLAQGALFVGGAVGFPREISHGGCLGDRDDPASLPYLGCF